MNDRQIEIHQAALQAAKDCKRAEARLLEVLIDVEKELVYVDLGFSSLFDYSIKALQLSECVAYSAIAIARKTTDIPKLLASIGSGTVTLSKARKIVSVITPQNQDAWIQKAATLTSRELEREVAKVNPRAALRDRAKFVSGDTLELSFAVNEKVLDRLLRARDLVSRSKGGAASYERTLETLLDFYLHKHDPLLKAERAATRSAADVVAPANSSESNRATQSEFCGVDESRLTRDQNTIKRTNPINKQFPGTVHSPRRSAIPASVKHTVRRRDQDRCQYIGLNGTRCQEKRWIELHHKIAMHQGGAHESDNLISLCSKHHRQLHRMTSGPTHSFPKSPPGPSTELKCQALGQD